MLLILGLADLIAGVVFLAQFFGFNVPISMVLFFAIYLIVKGGIFVLISLDLGSAIDIIAGGVLLAGLFLAIPSFLPVLFGIMLLVKGTFSLLA